MALLVGIVILMFALGCAAVCWEESRNLPKRPCHKKAPAAAHGVTGLLKHRG